MQTACVKSETLKCLTSFVVVRLASGAAARQLSFVVGVPVVGGQRAPPRVDCEEMKGPNGRHTSCQFCAVEDTTAPALDILTATFGPFISSQSSFGGGHRLPTTAQSVQKVLKNCT